MFMGEYQHSLDNKNRISVPAKFREKLGREFIMSKGLEGCIYVFTTEQWEVLANKLKELPFTDKDANAFVRFIFSGACEIEMDKQGRALIPQNLIEYAHINKEIVSIGVCTRIEIWSKESWNSYNNDNIDYDKIAEKMAYIGI